MPRKKTNAEERSEQGKLDGIPEPWQQLQNESDEAYEAFSTYMSMGVKRSLVKVAQQLGKNEQLISRWSSRWSWTERIRAHTNYLDKKRLDEELEAYIEMRLRHLKVSDQFLDALIERLETIDVNELSPSDMAKWFDIAVKVGNLAMGKPTENIKQDIKAHVGVDHETVKSIIMNERAAALAAELFAELNGDNTECKLLGANPAGLSKDKSNSVDTHSV